MKTDSESMSTAINRGKHFHGTHRQSSAPASSQPFPVASARMASDINHQQSLASINAKRDGPHKPRSQSNPPTYRKGRRKAHLSRSPTFGPTYVCDKHRCLAQSIQKVTRLSAGDSHISELANDTEETKPHQQEGTTEATAQPKPSSYAIPFVLARKLKHGEDPNRIPAEAIHETSIYRGKYMRLHQQPSTMANNDKDPNKCNIKVIKFQNVEIIEQHEPQLKQEGTVILKIIHKSRQLQQPQKRIDLIEAEYNDLTKMMLSYVFQRWADTVKMWKLEGYLQKVEPYETVDFDAHQQQTPLPVSPSSSSSSSPDVERLSRSNSVESIKQYMTDEQAKETRETVRKYLVKKGPAYQDTITTQLRYNFRRKKRFYPVHLMEHVLKYKRPPFWNYSRNYRGFSVLLNKYQLDNLYELVPPNTV